MSGTHKTDHIKYLLFPVLDEKQKDVFIINIFYLQKLHFQIRTISKMSKLHIMDKYR